MSLADELLADLEDDTDVVEEEPEEEILQPSSAKITEKGYTFYFLFYIFFMKTNKF